MPFDDYPAAHSMDTNWFAVDGEGRVGLFQSDIKRQLSGLIDLTDRGGECIAVYNGPTPKARRREIQESFNKDPKDPLRILIAKTPVAKASTCKATAATCSNSTSRGTRAAWNNATGESTASSSLPRRFTATTSSLAKGPRRGRFEARPPAWLWWQTHRRAD
jgi:hypothetical protein